MRKIWCVEPDTEEIFKEALYLFKQQQPTAVIPRMKLTRKTWVEYRFLINGHIVNVILRGEWWWDKADPLGLLGALDDCDAMLNVEIDYQCVIHAGIYFHKRGSALNTGWQKEE